MTKFKTAMKEFGKSVWVFLKGVFAALVGFADIVAILFGYNCFVNIRAADGWGAIGYFLGALAMVVIFVVLSYIFGVFVTRYQKFSRKN